MNDIKKKLKVLYAEDDDIIREIIYSNLLSQIFTDVTLATNGQEALDIYTKNMDFDILITDINMPHLSGIDLAKEIKKISPQLDIVIISAHSDTTNLIEAIKVGISDFILKPIDFDMLLETLNKISQRILQQRELEQKNAMLFHQSKLALIGETLSMIAHQWKQPLTTISINAGSINIKSQTEMLDNEEATHLSNIILQKVDYLGKTIENFKNFFKPEEDSKKVNLQEIIVNAVDILKPVLDEYKIDINIESNSNKELQVYKNEFTQVIVHIINNAKDALLENSVDTPTIDVRTKNDTEFITIEIEDNGKGIDDEILEKIFDPYFSTKSKNETGLGLYMAKIIIEIYLGGTITAKNTKDGAIFTLKLPISPF
jgi:signal transduction histidine kinase